MAEEPELDEFESLVADPIDRLPDEFQKVLEGVPIVVSDLGADVRAYGQLTTVAGMSEVWGLGLFPFVTVAAF